MGAKVTFYPVTRIIQVTQAPVLDSGEWVVDLDVATDVYSDGKEDWKTYPELNKLIFPVRYVGGQSLPGSKKLGVTFFLKDGWRIRPYEGDHVFRVNGNLYTETGESPFVPTIGAYNILLTQQVSSLVDSTIQQLAEIEFASFGNVVTIDLVNGYSGTEYMGKPVGTYMQPSNNMTDALAIANSRGLATFFIKGTATLGSGIDFQEMSFLGESPTKTYVIIDTSADVTNCEFSEMDITGVLDGGNTFTDSAIHDLNYINGYIDHCGMKGNFILGGNKKAVISDCYSVDPNDPPIVDMGGSGQSLIMPNYSGSVTIKNLNDGTQAIKIGINAGKITLDSTITAGTIIVSGNGICEDNTTGTATVNTDGLVNTTEISRAVWDEPIGSHLIEETTGHQLYHQAYKHKVTVDEINGTSGTAFPIGTEEYPVNNLADALTIANAHHFKAIHVQNQLTINGENVEEMTFSSDRSLGNVVTIISMVNAGNCYFTDLTVSGTLSGGVRFTTCVLGALTGFDGGAKNCLLTDNITITGTGANYFTECDTYMTSDSYVTLSVGTHNLNLIRCRGAWEIADLTGTQSIACDLNGHFKVASSCISGLVAAAGDMRFIDESGPGCTVINGALNVTEIANGVLDEALADHQVSGSVGEAFSLIKNVEGGRWRRTGTQMIFYAEDNTTEIARFDLFKSDGSAAGEDDSVFERKRV